MKKDQRKGKRLRNYEKKKKTSEKSRKEKKKILLAGFLGQELLGPQASWRVIPHPLYPLRAAFTARPP